MNWYKKALEDSIEDYGEMMEETSSTEIWNNLRRERKIVRAVLWAAENPEKADLKEKTDGGDME